MKKVTMAVLGAMTLVTVGACGGDDAGSSPALDAEGSAFATAIATSMSEDSGMPFDATQAQCIAEGVVEVVGVQAFIDAGMDASDVSSTGSFDFPELSDAQNKDLAAIFLDGDCVDMGELMADLMMQSSTGSLTEEQAKCLGDGMAKSENFAGALVAAISGDDSADPGSAMTADLMNLIDTCGVPLDAFG